MGAIPWGFSYAQGGETMPKKPLRPCSHPGCPNLCEGQFCEQHRVEERRKYDKYERSSDVNRKYGRAWKRIRDRYAAEHPLCEMCLKEGRLTPVQEVHHILPVSKGGTHARDNLMSLCQSCHTKIHHDLGDRYSQTWGLQTALCPPPYPMKRFVKCFSQFIDAKQDFFKRKAPCGQHGAS